jgi:hypothetical protein
VVNVNSKEENSSDFCPNYVQEFGLRRRIYQVWKAEATACLIRLKLVVENQELFLQRDVVALQPLVCLAQPLIPGLAKPNILATKHSLSQ